MKQQIFRIPLVALILLAACAKEPTNTNPVAVAAATEVSMPTLHKIESYTFEGPYSCGGSYEKSALFLSDASKKQNAPDLLLNGCLSQVFIQASTAGDDISMISDLGAVPLKSVNAMKSLNYDGTVGQDNMFKANMPIVAGHTYVVLIARSSIRALYALQVNYITLEGKVGISYAVKSYSVQSTEVQSPGFNWSQGNQ